MKSQLRANTTIDSLRNILIILVIMVHMSGVAVLSQFSAAEGLVYDVLMAITLFCIPAFFAIAGFFAYQKDNSPTANQKRLKRIWSLLKILIWAELLYIALSSLFVGLPSVLGAFADKGHLLNFLSDAVPVPTIFDSLLLYYIVVLLFVSTITLGFGKYRDKLLAILAIVAFVIANLGFYLLHIRGYAVVDQYVGTGQNRVLAGLLYFSIGYFIRKYQTKLSKIKTKLIVVLFLATLALFALEKIYFTPYGVTAPIVVALGLSLCVKFPNLFSNKAKIIPAIGNRYTLYIYIFHPLILWLFSTFLLKYLQPVGLLEWIFSVLLVFFATLLLSYLFIKIRDFSIHAVKHWVGLKR